MPVRRQAPRLRETLITSEVRKLTRRKAKGSRNAADHATDENAALRGKGEKKAGVLCTAAKAQKNPAEKNVKSRTRKSRREVGNERRKNTGRKSEPSVKYHKELKSDLRARHSLRNAQKSLASSPRFEGNQKIANRKEKSNRMGAEVEMTGSAPNCKKSTQGSGFSEDKGEKKNMVRGLMYPQLPKEKQQLKHEVGIAAERSSGSTAVQKKGKGGEGQEGSEGEVSSASAHRREEVKTR